MAIHLDSDEQRLPGMASSNSRNEINAAKEKEPMLVAFRGGWQAKVGVMHNPDVKHPSLNPPAASEDKNTPVYHIDLDSESIDKCGTTQRIKVKGPLWQTLSPWRRNKVAPSPLQSNSDSTLQLQQLQDEKENAYPQTTRTAASRHQLEDATRPISAPLQRKIGTIEIYSETSPVKIQPIVSQEYCSDATYSQVDKKRQKDVNSSPPPLPARPEEYDPRYIGSSPSLQKDFVESGNVVSVLSRASISNSTDSLYESLQDENEEEEQYSEIIDTDPHLYKGLTKHQDNRNVQLLSVQQQSSFVMDQIPPAPESVAINSNMSQIHLAAAKGNKKELAAVLSTLPIIQDPVEMVLGSNKFCRREGVDERDGKGRSALVHAVHHGHLECVQLLANSGANVNLEFADKSTCLHDAAYTGDIKMIALLLSLGADGMKQDKDGRVPLHWCTHNFNPDCIHLLLDKVPGLTANIPDSSKMTPLMWAAFHGRPQIVEALKQRGGDPKLVDCDGMRAIHWSVKSHDKQTLKSLLTLESSEYQDFKGRTAINHAAETGFVKAVEIIKNVRPLSVNDKDHNGRTPLHWAAVCEKPDMIRVLLAAGGDADIKDIHEYTALDYAIEKSHTYCALLLTNYIKQRDSTDDDRYVLNLNEGSSIGIRTLVQQEGKVLGQDIEKLTEENVIQLKAVCTGAWMNKFTTNGKGPVHPRFFWTDPTTLRIHWAKNIEARYIATKETKTDLLVGVRTSASTTVVKRRDFNPVTKHKFAFTIFTKDKVLDVVALSSEDFKTWLNGLQLLLNLGSTKAIEVINRPTSH